MRIVILNVLVFIVLTLSVLHNAICSDPNLKAKESTGTSPDIPKEKDNDKIIRSKIFKAMTEVDLSEKKSKWFVGNRNIDFEQLPLYWIEKDSSKYYLMFQPRISRDSLVSKEFITKNKSFEGVTELKIADELAVDLINELQFKTATIFQLASLMDDARLDLTFADITDVKLIWYSGNVTSISFAISNKHNAKLADKKWVATVKGSIDFVEKSTETAMKKEPFDLFSAADLKGAMRCVPIDIINDCLKVDSTLESYQPEKEIRELIQCEEPAQHGIQFKDSKLISVRLNFQRNIYMTVGWSNRGHSSVGGTFLRQGKEVLTVGPLSSGGDYGSPGYLEWSGQILKSHIDTFVYREEGPGCPMFFYQKPDGEWRQHTFNCILRGGD